MCLAATVEVPLGEGTWALITVERLSTGSKRISVAGNTLSTLLLQPWLEGKQLKSATPAGYKADTPSGHGAGSLQGTRRAVRL